MCCLNDNLLFCISFLIYSSFSFFGIIIMTFICADSCESTVEQNGISLNYKLQSIQVPS